MKSPIQSPRSVIMQHLRTHATLPFAQTQTARMIRAFNVIRDLRELCGIHLPEQGIDDRYFTPLGEQDTCTPWERVIYTLLKEIPYDTNEKRQIFAERVLQELRIPSEMWDRSSV